MTIAELTTKHAELRKAAFVQCRMFTHGTLDPRHAGYKSREDAVFAIIKKYSGEIEKLTLKWEQDNP